MKNTFNTGGNLNLSHTNYQVIGLKGDKILIEEKDTKSIYYADHKTRVISRKISKAGTIRLAGSAWDVMMIAGVAFHLENS